MLSLTVVWLETSVDERELRLRFGPLPAFSRRIPRAEIVSAERGRSAVIDGWGIHWVPGRGWTWNVHGRDCVELRMTDGRQVRVGTDDPVGLLHALGV